MPLKLPECEPTEGKLDATHCHCHNQIHGGKGNLSTQFSTYNKGQFAEEPDERNLSRPVLKTSRKVILPAEVSLGQRYSAK
jgi:hypothetical protein